MNMNLLKKDWVSRQPGSLFFCFACIKGRWIAGFLLLILHLSALSTKDSFLVPSFLSDLYIYSLVIQVLRDVFAGHLQVETPENCIHYVE